MTDPKEFIPAEALKNYAVRKGYVAAGVSDKAARIAVASNEPRLYAVLRKPGPYPEDLKYGHWPDFLFYPPAMLVDEETGDIMLTQHGENVALGWETQT